MKYAFWGLVIASFVIFGFFLFGTGAINSLSQKANLSETTTNGQVLKFAAEIKNRTYIPIEINVPYGSTIELTVKNNDNEQHGLSIQDFGIDDFVGPNQTKTVVFTANKRGQSTTFCSTTHPEKLIINVN